MKRLQVSKVVAFAHSSLCARPQLIKTFELTPSITVRRFGCNHHHNHNVQSHSHDHNHGQSKDQHSTNNHTCCQHHHNHTNNHDHNHHHDHNHKECGSHSTSETKCETTVDITQGSDQEGLDIPAECWHCGKFMGSQELFCTEPTCGRVQPIQTKKLNLFNVFNIPQSYFINEKQLEAAYKELQKKLHPDKFASKSIDEKNVSTTSSSAINFAFQVSFFSSPSLFYYSNRSK